MGCETSERMPNRMFSFLNPLAAEIWLWMLVAYVFVSVTIWVVARFSPREWTLPVSCPCTPGEEEEDLLVGGNLQLHNDFTLGNAFWFTLGSLMQQGSDLNPKVTHPQPANISRFPKQVDYNFIIYNFVNVIADLNSLNYLISVLGGKKSYIFLS